MTGNNDLGVRQCFKRKNILITGGTGFLGKVLIEKFLRTIPGIGNIYLFMRHKKGKTVHERIETMFNDQVFERLNPNSIEKIVVVEGDIFQPKLGISEEDRNAIIENVDVIFHIAASIRFDDPLTKAIITNVRFTRDIIELGLEAKHLKAFVHVSTAYCNSDKKIVDEKLYAAYGDWRESIEIAESSDQTLIEYLTAKYIHPLPNTYTYTKSLGEHVVTELCRGKIPAVIIRPTMVTNALKEPIPGWTDNLNGPIGMCFGVLLGVVKILHAGADAEPDMVPVDVTVNVLIVSAFDLMKNPNTDEVAVYNNSAYQYCSVSMQEHAHAAQAAIQRAPPNNMVWYPGLSFTKCKYNYFLRVILSQIIIALIIDVLLMIMKSPTRMFAVQKKIYITNLVGNIFIRNTWTFKNDRTKRLESNLSNEDVDMFGFTEALFEMKRNLSQFHENNIEMIQKCVFKQKIHTEKNLKILHGLWILDIVTKASIFICLMWILLKSNILISMYNRTEHYLANL